MFGFSKKSEPRSTLREISKEHYDDMQAWANSVECAKGFLHSHAYFEHTAQGSTVRFRPFFAQGGKYYMGEPITIDEFWEHVHSLA